MKRLDLMRCFLGGGGLVMPSILAVFAYFASLPCRGQDPRSLTQELIDATRAGEPQAIERHMSRVAEMGTSAVEALWEEIPNVDESTGFVLLLTLGRIPGSESTAAIWASALDLKNENLRRRALNVLDNRIIAAPQDLELLKITDQLQKASPQVAAGIGSALLRSGNVSSKQLAEPIIARFLLAAESYRPGASEGLSFGNYLDPGIRLVNEYVRHLDRNENPGFRTGLVEHLSKETRPLQRRWLAIALGMSRYAGVSRDLEIALRNADLDLSTRALVLRAYAKSLGADARALLQEFVNDNTLNRNGLHKPLAIVARDELARLSQDAP